MPGMFKIGKSIKDPNKDRLAELSSSTSVPEPFELEYYCFIEKFDAFETRLHRELSAFRPNPTREFFRVELTSILDKIIELAPLYGGIKFQEPSEIISAPSTEKKAFENEVSNVVTSTSESTNSDVILEYNQTAREIYKLLERFPGNGHVKFKEALPSLKHLDEASVRHFFKREFERHYIEPFDDPIYNYYYKLLAQNNRHAAQEFYDASKVLKESITARQLTIDISKKFHLKILVSALPLAELQIAAKEIQKTYSKSPVNLNPYLKEFDLRILEGRFFYTVNYIGDENGPSYVIKEVDRENLHSLYQFFACDFNPEEYSKYNSEDKKLFLKDRFKSVKGYARPSGTASNPWSAIKDTKHQNTESHRAESSKKHIDKVTNPITNQTKKPSKTWPILFLVLLIIGYWIVF